MAHITTARALSKNKNLEKNRRVSRKKKKETCIRRATWETLDVEKGNKEEIEKFHFLQMSYFMVVSLLFLRNILGSRFIFYYGLPLPHPHTTYTQPAFGSDFFKRKGKMYPQSCKKLMIIIIKSVSMRFLLLLCTYLFST